MIKLILNHILKYFCYQYILEVTEQVDFKSFFQSF